MKASFSILSAGLVLAGTLILPAQAADRILNASYDVSRELFQAINPAFIEDHAAQTGNTAEVRQSHGGSSSQARSILQGLSADVVTFNQTTDIQVLVEGGLVSEDWQERLQNRASPFYSLPAFLVRAGNPKNIRSWEDLAREDVSLVFPNPKTSGNGRYTYLAAWGDAHQRFEGDEAKIRDFIQRFVGNVRVFDTGGRGATTTFAERGIGDVLITFESEVNLIRREHGGDRFEVIIPPRSLLAEFPVAVVDRVVDRRESRPLAEAYLQYLYSSRAQEILAGFHYRVIDESVVASQGEAFPEVELFTAEDIFGSWAEAQQRHFSDGGTLDQAQAAGRRR
ncbi:thiosulfate ABC transporter substrate-binding protein CysP [Ectothiorhodospira lacustris]|uniref:thiosulfate ABC transporter substrate-binding protein CysP n=1 Tax=Ectothiorhodospira lacustris TaxID=2899127 RepID=UPI001EE79448|nr:thiosulfate ABC transporter substrate-binding protein CysP [Ectothiorhodospira lacustris]MCG5500281.1 thiosulfate ABC transporter substrate-binding protein CysP [Ectothiorhodospira lacustris]